MEYSHDQGSAYWSIVMARLRSLVFCDYSKFLKKPLGFWTLVIGKKTPRIWDLVDGKKTPSVLDLGDWKKKTPRFWDLGDGKKNP
jgi:hypothetical protein